MIEFTVALEVSPPWQWKPWLFRSDSMVRVGWACFAVALIRVPFRELVTERWEWEDS